MDYGKAIRYLFPHAVHGEDFKLFSDESGQRVMFWNTATLGVMPTPSILTDAAAYSDIKNKKIEIDAEAMRRIFNEVADGKDGLAGAIRQINYIAAAVKYIADTVLTAEQRAPIEGLLAKQPAGIAIKLASETIKLTATADMDVSAAFDAVLSNQ